MQKVLCGVKLMPRIITTQVASPRRSLSGAKNRSLPDQRVAAAPSAPVVTYAQVIADAETASAAFVDDQTPRGHFGVVVRNVGGIQTYWFKGEIGSAHAPVVARTQDGVGHYLGGGLMGGHLSAPEGYGDECSPERGTDESA